MIEKDEKESERLPVEDSILERMMPYIIRLWEQRRLLLKFYSVVSVLAIVYLLFIAHPYYDSVVTILPEYGSKTSTLSGLADLASLAGVSIGDNSPTDIYQDILNSEAVLKPVIYSKYKTEEFKDSVNLIQYFEIDPDKDLSLEIRERKMFLELLDKMTKDRIETSVDKLTKILTIRVRMPEPKLSADVVNKIADYLDLYIRTTRKSYATNQAYYIQQRLSVVKDSLSVAEERLKDFREQNKVLVQSPELLMDEARFTRDVDLLQTVFTELTKQMEMAKIDEIKDTPVINIKEDAGDPVIKTGPKRIRSFLLILFFTMVFSLPYFLFHDNIDRSLIQMKSVFVRR